MQERDIEFDRIFITMQAMSTFLLVDNLHNLSLHSDLFLKKKSQVDLKSCQFS